MARFKDHQRALILRKRGESYGQIKNKLNVGKSTLSTWLKNYPLSKEKIKELRDNNEKRIERYRDTMRTKKEARLKRFYFEQKKLILPFTKRDLLIAGLFLYLGEGSKSKNTQLAITNTDPAIIKFFIIWLNKLLKIPKNKLKVQLHLYADMNKSNEINFWSKTLQISINQFNKPYIKKNNYSNINHKGSYGHGTCSVVFGNARLTEKIQMSIKVITDKFMDA